MEWAAIVTAARALVKRMFSRRPRVHIVVKDGSSLSVVQGDQHIHYHFHGPAEVVSDKPIRIIEAAASEAMGLQDRVEHKLIKPDGTVETYRFDGDGKPIPPDEKPDAE